MEKFGTYKYYDILFGLSTYKSANLAIRMLKSLHKVKGQHLAVVVSPLEEDVIKLKNALEEFEIDVLIFKSNIDNQCLGRAWGFVWAVNNGITARYYCSCDDDLEFTEQSYDMLDRLDSTYSTHGFSMMAFDSNHPYKYPYFEEMHGYLKFNPTFIDGNCMFTRFYDNLLYGVMDAPLESPSVFYTEVEYLHRLMYFTKKPAIVDFEKEFYLHHIRTDANVQVYRQQRYKEREKAGRYFWFLKFGISIEDFPDEFMYPTLYKQVIQNNLVENFKKHLIFKNEWNHWEKIYSMFSTDFILFGENNSNQNKIRKPQTFTLKSDSQSNQEYEQLDYNEGFENSTLKKLQKLGIYQPYRPLRLHLGCGEQYLEGYINIDFPQKLNPIQKVKADYYEDITKLDFPCGTVDEIRLHHVFEHFDYVTSIILLIKWYEWLKVGGILRIETPDLEGCAQVILSSNSLRNKQAIVRHLFGSQEATWAYHLDGWFKDKFQLYLQNFGFEVKVNKVKWNKYPYLPNIEVIATKKLLFTRKRLIDFSKSILWGNLVSVEEGEVKLFELWKNKLENTFKT